MTMASQKEAAGHAKSANLPSVNRRLVLHGQSFESSDQSSDQSSVNKLSLTIEWLTNKLHLSTKKKRTTQALERANM